jgi:hypothetical protein
MEPVWFKNIGDRLLEAVIITDNSAGYTVCISRITSFNGNKRWPFLI